MPPELAELIYSLVMQHGLRVGLLPAYSASVLKIRVVHPLMHRDYYVPPELLATTDTDHSRFMGTLIDAIRRDFDL